MKLSTLILATTCLLAISTLSFANTGSISLKGIHVPKMETVSSIKLNLLGIASGKVSIKMNNEPQGIYTAVVIDTNRRILGTKEIEHNQATSTETVDFGRTFSEGAYTIIIFNCENQRVGQTTMLLM